ncbi:hypothetical protein BJ878DRAFT_475891 [Calycina marina]|uniref:Uncharacterized protein n=1 Tax=Calycina marina TaxID=1763456 RepID=A0A9P7ZBM6_9HELO|nr:hypothetical protein BJ878DRAFT_475891 [Calycina marina]
MYLKSFTKSASRKSRRTALRCGTRSGQKWSIIIRMGPPALGIAMALYQIFTVTTHQRNQQCRSLMASINTLLATFISNSMILGSLMMDKGYKEKYKHSLYHPQRLVIREGAKWDSGEELIQQISGGDYKDHMSIQMRNSPFEKEVGRDVSPAKLANIHVAATWETMVACLQDKESLNLAETQFRSN